MRDEIKELLYDFNTILGPEVALGEYWALVLYKGRTDWGEHELDTDYIEPFTLKEQERKSRRKLEIHRTENPLLTHLLVKSDNLRVNEQEPSIKVTFPFQTETNFSNDDIQSPLQGGGSERIPKRVLQKFKILYEGLSVIKQPNPMIQASPVHFNVLLRPMASELADFEKNDCRTFQKNFV